MATNRDCAKRRDSNYCHQRYIDFRCCMDFRYQRAWRKRVHSISRLDSVCNGERNSRRGVGYRERIYNVDAGREHADPLDVASGTAKMSRALLVLANDDIRSRAIRWVKAAPTGTRLEFKETKRTLPQNDRMWAMLTDISTQKSHYGNRYPPGIWKCLMMHACGHEVQFIPSLDCAEIIPMGYHSSDLGVSEMSELIEFMFSWGTQNNVVFHEPNGVSYDVE